MHIWKYQIAISDVQTIEMPAGAKILSLQTQDGTPCIWALCNEEASKELRTFTMYGTGHIIHKDPGTFIGTFQMDGGELVFHVFDPAKP